MTLSMPFLFFGSRAVRQRLGEGEFTCPRCRTIRPYRLVRAQNHAHLYWVPLMKLGQPQDYVECGGCRAKFDPRVLGQGALDEGELRGALARAALAAMVAVARGPAPSQHERELMGAALGAVSGQRWEPEEVTRLVDGESGDVALAAAQLARIASTLSPRARESLMEAVLRVATAGGPMTPAQADAVQHLAGALEMSSAHLKGIMLELAERRGRVRT